MINKSILNIKMNKIINSKNELNKLYLENFGESYINISNNLNNVDELIELPIKEIKENSKRIRDKDL